MVIAGLVPRARRYLRWPVAIAAVLTVFEVLITVDSGDHLAGQTRPSDLLSTHKQLADAMLPLVLIVALASIALLVVTSERVRFKGYTVTWIVAGIAVVAAVGMTVQVVRTGHSGAESKWHGVGDRPLRASIGG